jgi:xanthine dehydrogenase accessory factor
MTTLTFRAIAELLERGESGALCTITKSEGSTPRHVGSKMLVDEHGGVTGTVGGGELEHRVTEEAARVIVDGRARLLSYSMADPARGDPGVCGGQVEVFVEPVLPPAKIVVVGAGHVGKAVAHLAKWLGFRVAISDDRVEFCNPQAVPDADEFYAVPLAELPERLNINAQTYLVLTTRGTAVDAAGLPALLKTRAAYLGVIGSRRRWATTLKALKAEGVDRRQLSRIHAPVGLELNAETPEEIAVSIMAEIIMLRNAGSGKPMKIPPGELTASGDL